MIRELIGRICSPRKATSPLRMHRLLDLAASIDFLSLLSYAFPSPAFSSIVRRLPCRFGSSQPSAQIPRLSFLRSIDLRVFGYGTRRRLWRINEGRYGTCESVSYGRARKLSPIVQKISSQILLSQCAKMYDAFNTPHVRTRMCMREQRSEMEETALQPYERSASDLSFHARSVESPSVLKYKALSNMLFTCRDGQ